MTDSEFIKWSNITAEDQIKKTHIYGDFNLNELKDSYIEFAKMHVQLALFHASGKAMLSSELHDFIEDSWVDGDKIDRQSILNSYPLSNIK